VNSVPRSLQTWPGRITRLDMNDEGQGRAARERPEALMRGCSLGLRWLNGTRARFGLLPGRGQAVVRAAYRTNASSAR
jgi:hypothetical protein